MSLLTSIGRSDGWARAQARHGYGLLAIIVGLHAVLGQAGLGAARALAQCTEEQELVPSDAAIGLGGGNSVAVDGDTIVMGWNGCASPGGLDRSCISAYVFHFNGSSWVEEQKLIPSDFLWSGVTSVAVDGDTIVMGADPGGCPASLFCNAAYVFHFNGNSWVEEQKLTPSDPFRGDAFGNPVAVDGDTIVVGARRHDSSSGAAYVFVRSAGVWTEQAILIGSGIFATDEFGFSVAVDGDTAIVGAYRSNTPVLDSGSAHVFVRSAGVWTEQAKLIASDIGHDQFGRSVAIDGDTVVVGTSFSRSAYVFVRFGGFWVQQAKLIGSVSLGRSVAIDGDTVVAAFFDKILLYRNDGFPVYTYGSALVFVRNAGRWTKQATLTKSDAAPNDNFGSSVAVDGNTVVVAASSQHFLPALAPSAFVFRCSPGTLDSDGDGVMDDVDQCSGIVIDDSIAGVDDVGCPIPITPGPGDRDGDPHEDDPGGQPVPGDGVDDGMVDQNPCGLLSFFSLTFMWFGLLGLRWSHRLCRG